MSDTLAGKKPCRAVSLGMRRLRKGGEIPEPPTWRVLRRWATRPVGVGGKSRRASWVSLA